MEASARLARRLRDGVEVALDLAQAPLLRLSLHRRITVFLSTTLLAVFLAFGYQGWAAISRTTEATLNERRATAIVIARHLDELIGHARAHVQVLARDVALGEGPFEERARRALERSHDQLRFFYSHLLVFDAQGRLVAVSPDDWSALGGQSWAVIQEALRSGRPTVSDLIDLPTSGYRGVLFATPVLDSGRVEGVVAGEMPFPHPSVAAVARVLELGRTGHMEVVDSRGVVLASTAANDLFLLSEHHRAYLPLLQARQAMVDRMAYEERDADGGGEAEFHVMAFVPLSSVPWGVGLGQTEEETFEAAVALRDHSLLVAAIALVVALACAWIGTRSVVQPINLLTEAGERMAAGDLETPIGLDQPDEVGRLARVLEGARLRLGQSLAEQTALSQELERRVLERTRELEASNRRLQTLMAVAIAAGRGGDRKQVLDAALRELVDTLGASAGWAFLWNEAQQGLQMVSDYRLSSRMADEELRVLCQDAGCVQALKTMTIISRPLATCPALSAPARKLADGEVCLCAPVRVGEQPLGTVCLALPRGRALEPEEVTLLQSVAHQVGVAFENARLTEEAARLEAQRRMELLRAEFLASVSHELRTPLGFIKGFTTTLLRQDVAWSDAQREEFLRIIDEECDRLTGLVDTLLDAARVHAGRLRLRCEPLELEAVVRRALARLNGSLGKHHVELRVEASPSIVADGARLEQVVVNLVQNAAKYSPEGGPIEVRLASASDGAHLSVLDRGIGIPADEVDRVFEPFYRVGGKAAAGIGGAGLGLAICRAIVTAHGGRIWAEPRQGGGTAFHLVLPWRARGHQEQEGGTT